MFSFHAAVLIFLQASAVNVANLDALCDIYYTNCEGTCDTQYGQAHSACNSLSDEHEYGKCFYNHDAGYLDDTDYKHLALCFVENTKDIEDFTCFKNATTVIDCGFDALNANMNFRLAPLGISNIITNTRHDAELTVDWGDLDVIVRPIEWDGCDPIIVNPGESSEYEVNPCETAIADYVPHMNLHACKMTEYQKTCSAVMLESTDLNATVDLTTNNMAHGEGVESLTIFFPTAGMWRLIGHIQVYEQDDAGVKSKWDIANAIEFEVLQKPPTNAPTVPVEAEGERTTGGNNTALIVCLILVAICAGGCGYCYWFGGFGDV